LGLYPCLGTKCAISYAFRLMGNNLTMWVPPELCDKRTIYLQAGYFGYRRSL
jgi:hypothetical protein